jgi:Rap1a immunity proteins
LTVAAGLLHRVTSTVHSTVTFGIGEPVTVEVATSANEIWAMWVTAGITLLAVIVALFGEDIRRCCPCLESTSTGKWSRSRALKAVECSRRTTVAGAIITSAQRDRTTATARPACEAGTTRRPPMRHAQCLAILASLLLTLGTANSQPTSRALSGTKLAESIREIDKIAQGQDGDAFEAGFAHGFVYAVWGLTRYDISSPADATLSQVCKVVEKYLEDHPEQLHLDAHVLVQRALKQAFPKSKATR